MRITCRSPHASSSAHPLTATIPCRHDICSQASELEPLVCREPSVPALPEERDEPDGRLRRPGYAKPERSAQRPFSAAQVIELRRELKKLADEYKLRDWGGGLDEASLWRRVSSSHELDALSLARHPASPTTKEQKNKENSRKSAVTASMPAAGRPSTMQQRPVDMRLDNDRALARAGRDFLVRHHLERTTGIGECNVASLFIQYLPFWIKPNPTFAGDGALLPSPTREKLEPAIPRRREEPSPAERDGQGRPKPSPKSSPRVARSQSVGPTAGVDRRSPKRRPLSQAHAHSKDSREDKAVAGDRHPRPSKSESLTLSLFRSATFPPPYLLPSTLTLLVLYYTQWACYSLVLLANEYAATSAVMYFFISYFNYNFASSITIVSVIGAG